MLNVCDLRVDSWSLQFTYEILLHKMRAHIVGQFRARRGIVFEVDFGSRKMAFAHFHLKRFELVQKGIVESP